MRPISEHPEIGVRVNIHFKDTERGNNGNRDGIWTSEKWQFRKPYTKDEYEDIPEHLEPIGWEEMSREPYSK